MGRRTSRRLVERILARDNAALMRVVPTTARYAVGPLPIRAWGGFVFELIS
jgi:hypothetical protein